MLDADVFGTKESPALTLPGSSITGPMKTTCSAALCTIAWVIMTLVALSGETNGAVGPGDIHSRCRWALVFEKSTSVSAAKSGGADPNAVTKPSKAIGAPALSVGSVSAAGTFTVYALAVASLALLEPVPAKVKAIGGRPSSA